MEFTDLGEKVKANNCSFIYSNEEAIEVQSTMRSYNRMT